MILIFLNSPNQIAHITAVRYIFIAIIDFYPFRMVMKIEMMASMEKRVTSSLTKGSLLLIDKNRSLCIEHRKSVPGYQLILIRGK